MQQEQDELNRVKDFDLDAYLDGIEPTQRVQTVNTRGDLLAKYGKVQEQRSEAIAKLSRLADSLPDEGEENNDTLTSASEDAARAEFEGLREDIRMLTETANAIRDEYAQHKVRVTFKVPDKSTRARVVSESQLEGHKGGSPANDDSMLRLMLAAAVEIVVIRGGEEIQQDKSKWTADRWSKFLDRIGSGQAKLLADSYLGLTSGEVTPPFSPES